MNLVGPRCKTVTDACVKTDACLVPSERKTDPPSRLVSGAQQDWLLLNLDVQWLSKFSTLNGKGVLSCPHFPFILKYLVLKSKLLSCNKATLLRKTNAVVPFAPPPAFLPMQSACWKGKLFLLTILSLSSYPVCICRGRLLKPYRLVHSWKVVLQHVTLESFPCPGKLIFCVVSTAITLSHVIHPRPCCYLTSEPTSQKVNMWF